VVSVGITPARDRVPADRAGCASRAPPSGRRFPWIVYASRKHRDRVNAKVMKDPRMAAMMEGVAMPFDGKRFIYGGFKVMVDL
jgi:uncharacterized protein YbaA (DUF1428 family)